MADVKSCGVLVFGADKSSFLLMRHPTRWDLPKGHIDPGESDLECALRELEEETGIAVGDIQIEKDFRFIYEYQITLDRGKKVSKNKQLIVFLGYLNRYGPEGGLPEIMLTEHIGFEWLPWNPPHKIQEKTIDPLLAAVADFFQTD